jgi:hypothetical protein
MTPIILRDSDAARRFLLQGLWFQRAMTPDAAGVGAALEWCQQIVGEGHALPPIGFVADIGNVALGLDRERRQRKQQVEIPGLPHGLIRSYEDLVLGKIYTDFTFERASDALRRYASGKERNRGLDYIIHQICERGQIPGVEFSTGVVRSLLHSKTTDSKPYDELLREGWEMLTQDGPMEVLIDLYKAIIAGARRMAEILAPEDVSALEQRTAIAEVGQYVAHRQIVQMANRMEQGLPRQKVRPLVGRREVPTRILDEDTYPVGGFSSISTKGTIESILHSQLAFMETDRALQPDLFDIKYLREELYYYSRDENQFLRRRRSFLFALYPDLTTARFKDAELPYQRIVMTMALLVLTVRKISEWLSTDALNFEILLVLDGATKLLDQEAELFGFLFRELIENETLTIEHIQASEIAKRCTQMARKTMCQCLTVSAGGASVASDQAVVTELRIAGPRPVIKLDDDEPESLPSDDVVESWTLMVERILQLWV